MSMTSYCSTKFRRKSLNILLVFLYQLQGNHKKMNENEKTEEHSNENVKKSGKNYSNDTFPSMPNDFLFMFAYEIFWVNFVAVNDY